MNSGSLRFFLRDQTRSAHASLDRTVGRLTSPERYKAFVLGSYAHRQPVEAQLQSVAWPVAFGDWRPCPLSSLIAADLDDLELQRPAVQPFPLSNDIASLVGVAYVVEGSALGAQLIWKMAVALGYDALRGSRHLARQDGSLANWRSLLAIMDMMEGIDRRVAVAAANATFEQATSAMKSNGFS